MLLGKSLIEKLLMSNMSQRTRLYQSLNMGKMTLKTSCMWEAINGLVAYDPSTYERYLADTLSQSGGRDTAGMGGRGGYMRLYKKGHDIKQVSDELKNSVPDHIKEKAREMARQELKRRLEELNMTASEATGYGALLEAVQGHIAQLFDLLERR